MKEQNYEQHDARAADGERSGQVNFDDRGNAVWETWRGKRLENPELAIAEDFRPHGEAPANKTGLRIGYDPYHSGALSKDSYRKKKDLRALSKWIEQQKNLGKPTER